jgi:hypothetical protein
MLNRGDSVISLGRAFPFKQDYWHSISNDAYYDQGKLWAISRSNSGSGKQTKPGIISFVEVDISDNGWEAGDPVEVGTGVTADIHIWGPGEVSDVSPGLGTMGNSSFKYQIEGTGAGVRLYLKSPGLAGNDVMLFNTRGYRVAHESLSGGSSNSVFLGVIPNGVYFLKVGNHSKSALEPVLISK